MIRSGFCGVHTFGVEFLVKAAGRDPHKLLCLPITWLIASSRNLDFLNKWVCIIIEELEVGIVGFIHFESHVW